jgi:hypothetical protein
VDNTDHTSDYGQIVRRQGVADIGRVWADIGRNCDRADDPPEDQRGKTDEQ